MLYVIILSDDLASCKDWGLRLFAREAPSCRFRGEFVNCRAEGREERIAGPAQSNEEGHRRGAVGASLAMGAMGPIASRVVSYELRMMGFEQQKPKMSKTLKIRPAIRF